MVDSNSDRRNILLIDSNFNYFPSITTFIDLNKSDVVIFDSNEHTYNDVLIMIRNKNQNGYNSVCILQNNSNSQFYQFSIKEKKCLLSLVETDEPTLSSWNEYINFINSLKTEFTITNLDLLAFTLYNDLNWKYVIDTLETQLQLSIRSSINLNQDGYWFFETHEGINIKNNYLLNQQVIIPETLPISTTKKLILIDNRIKDIETIINSMNENTYCIVFNYFYDTYDTILSKIRFLSGSNRYILDNFFYETPELPVRMDSEGNHCTTCDEFSIDDLVLSPSTLQSEYLAHTNNPTTSLWEFYNDSTNISIQKPIFFQRAKKVETTEIVSSSSNIVPLKYRQRPFVKITDLDEIYQLAQTSGEVTNTLEFECIGIIQHTVQPYLGYKLVNNTGEPAVIQDIQTTDSNLLSWSSFVTFIQSLKTIYQMAILDLMACALYTNPDWKYIIDKLEIQENITIRASNDNTGSSNYGGNWVLETNNVNLTNVYFTDNINNWQYVLATYIDNRFYGLRWNDSMYATRAYDARLKIAAGTSNFTIETWYYETAARYNCTIVDMGDYNYTFQIRNQNTSALGLSLYNPNMGWLYGESAVVPVAQWSHLAITRSGSTFTFYVNGVARQTFTNSTSLYSNNSTFAIGWQSPDTCQCNRMKTDCVLYDIRLWNVARTASEIQMYRNRIVPANSSGLVANYLCTDNSNTFNDRTSNALHTTIQNYSSSQWTNSLVPIPNIGFLINNGYSLTTYNNSALNALSNFDDITNTDFSNVNLSSVNFSNSNLTGCNFTGANLSGANMNGANLTNANLTNANLNGTYLIGANLTGATTTGSTIASAITTTTLTKSNSSAFYLTPPAGASTTYGPTWTQLGSTIYGANANDYLGFCVSISKDGNVIAVSSPGSDAAGTDRGFVKVFNWNGSSWVQRGGTFYGISNNDLITTSKLSADGNYVIFYYNDTAVSNKGFTGVYIYDSNKTVEDTNVNSASYGPIGWSRVGGFIYNESTSDKSWDKNTISISGNGQIIAIGCDLNDGTSGSASDNRGSVRVYRYDPNKLTEVTDQANANFGPVGWTRMGADIDGESAGDNFGAMIDLSTDGTVLAGAAVNSDVNGTDNGQIRVFKWNSGSSTWVQRGRTIYGQIISSGATSQKFANALSLSADGNIIACGNSTYATFRGITKTLEWNSFNNDYQMVGQQIEEYGTYQLSSHCVSLSSDGQILVVGAYDADRGLSENGTLRVYKLTTYATTLISTPPTNMTGYTHDNTTIYRMTITGNSSTGSVWGTNIYTADSNIARAAVHAGVVANGQTKEVYIKMERFQYKYFGSTRNGVTTNDFTDSSTTYLSYYFMDTPKLWVQLGNEIAGQSVNMWIGLTCAVSGDGTRFITGGWANSNGLYQVYSLSSTDNYSHTSSISSVAEVYGDIVIPKKAGFTTIASKQSSTITTSLLEITGTAPTFTSFPSVSKFTTDPQFTLTLPESNSTGAFTLTTGTVGTKVKYTRNALRFDGVNDTIILNSYPLLNTNQQTLEGWVFLTTYPCTILVINGNGGLNILADGRIDIWSRSSGIWSNFSSTSAVPLNTWTYVALVKNDNGYNKLYINNNIVYNAADTSSGNLNNCEGLSFGANAQASSSYSSFILSEFRIWSIARTEKQIRDNYNREVLSNSTGLQVYYKFNQGTADGNNSGLTTLTDSTSNGYNGTLSNFALSGTTSNYVTGVTILSKDKYNISNETSNIVTINPDVSVNALNFNGTNNYIDLVSNITELGQANFTIECWIKTTGSRMGIINCQDSDNTWEIGEKSFYLDSSGKPAFVGFGNNFILSTQAVDDNQWHHVAVVWSYSTTTGYIYIDGQDRTNKLNNLVYQANNNNAGRFIVGVPNNVESVNYFTGSMCELRIWSVARTASQIYQNFRRVLNGNETGLVCYNRLNQGTANGANSGLTTATNNMVSGGYAGTLYNFSLVSNTSNWTDGVTLRPNKDITITGVGVATITAIQEEAGIYDVGTTTATITVALQNFSSVLTFDGDNDAIDVGVPAWTYSTQFRTTMTVECWFKTADTNNQKIYTTLVGRNISGGISSTSQFSIYMLSTGEIGFGLTNNSDTGFAHTTVLSYKDAQWHHVAGTYDSATGTKIIYIDGVAVKTDTSASFSLLSNNSSTKLVFGSDNAAVSAAETNRQFRGSLSDIRIWSTVRTPSQISSNYRQRLIGNESGLLGYWKLNQGYGTGWGSYTVALDSTNNRINGTLTNFASPSSNWTLSSLAFLPRISDITLGSKNGLYSLSDSSFTFIDPLSNSFGTFSYTINSAAATISNGTATTKTVYTTSGAVTIPTLSLYDFPEIASLADWEMNISFTVTSGNGSWRALLGDMYNEINSRGWGLWVSSASPPKIHWSFIGSTFEPAQTIVSLNTPYILNVVKSSAGTITLTLQNVAGTYNNSLLISNLVASYNLDSNGNDSSGNSNTLTNVNTVTFNTSDYKRGSGAALFNGNNYFEISNNGRFSPDNLTVALWIKPQTNSSYQSIASCRASNPWRGWMLYINPSASGSNLEIWSSSDGSNFTGQTSLFNSFGSLNTWVHLAFTLNKSTSELIVYINGTAFTTTTLGYTNNTTTNLRIGAGANEQTAAFHVANGTMMDDFRIYNKVLTDAEIGTIVADSSFSSSFSIGANTIGKGPVTIGGWRSYGGEIFPGTISYVNVKVPTNQRLVTLVSNTGATPATITATQDSFMDFDTSTKTASLTIGNITPSLSNFSIPTKNFGDAAFSLTAPTSDSPGSFTYTSSNTSVATISGSTVTIVAAGTSTITATQAASGSYTSGTITATLTINQIAPTLSNFSIPTKNFGDAAFSLTAPTSNSGGSFTYTSSNTSVATISGSTVTIVAAGTSTITATQAASGNYTSGTITATLTVNTIAPTISNFTIPTKYFGQPTFNLTAPTSNSGGSFSYTSSNTSVATISGSTVTLLSVGTSTITATQAAATNYTQGTITATLTVNSYENANLTGFDLSNNNLTGINLSNSTLTNVTSGSIIGNPTLPTNYILVNGYIIGPNVNLTNANLSSQNLTNANFTGVNLTGANLTSATLTGVISGSITGTPTLSASYSMINGYIIGPGVNLSSKNLSNMNLLTSDLTNVNLNSANIDNTNFTNTTLTGVTSGGITGTPILPTNYHIIKGYIVGANVNLTGATLTNINYSKVSYSAFDDFISGPTAQSTNNDWQYFEVNTDRSSAVFLSNWQPEGTTNIPNYGQWDNNRDFSSFPLVQKVGDSGTIVSGYGPTFTGPALVMHPNNSDTFNAGLGYKNNTGGTINVNIDVALSLLFGTTYNLTGINYFIQRGLLNDARYSLYVSSSIPEKSTNTFTFNKKNIELQNGEFIYLIINRNGNFEWDFTRVVFNVTLNNFRNLSLTSVNFTNTNLSGTNLSNATLTNCNVNNTDLRTATLTGLTSSGLTGTPLLPSDYYLTNGVIITNPTLSNFTVAAKNFGDAAFNLTAPTSNSGGSFTYTSSNTSVASISGSTVTIVGAGSSTITATQAASGIYTSGTITGTFTVNPIAPTLSNFIITTKNFGDASFNLTAPTSNSSGAFTYTSSNTSVATISGSTVTIVGAGTSTITATQASTTNYTSGTITATFTVNQIAPTISNFTIPTKNFGDASFNLTAPTSNSGGSFTYTSSNTSVATISGSTVTIVGAGSSTITATQTSTTNYTSGTITAIFVVNPIAPTISNFTIPTKNFGDASFSLTAPTSNSGGLFSYTSSNTSVATISGSTVTIVGAGTSTITATQASTTNYTSGTITATLTVNQIAPTLSNFTVAAKNFGSSPFSLTAPTSNSGGSFTYTSSNTSVATISGSTVTVINAGSTTITATQASTTNYTSGTITTTFTVNQIAPGLSNFSMPTKNFGDSTFNIISNVHTSFYIRTGGSDWINSIINNDTSNTNIQYWNPDLQWYEMLYDNPNRIASQFRFFAAYVTKYYNITSGSASVITGSGNVGTYSFTYNGGTSYTGTFTGYNVGAQTWNYTLPVSVNVNTLVPTSNSSGSITYSSSNTSVATISGNTITIVGGGSSTITATQASTTNYTSDTITATLTINPIAPTLSNFTIASKNYGSLPFNLTAPTSNSSGSFSYSSSDTSVATISGSTITTINAGSSTITATQAATANYTSSTITTTFTVNPIAPSLVISSPIATDFSFTQNSFTQVGQSLTVQSVNVDGYFVPSIVKISEDGTKIAVGGIGGNNKGIVRMYSLTSGTWTQIGGDILGTYGGGYAGMGFSKGAGNHAISISADGTILTTAETGISDPYTTRVINVFKYDASKTVAQNNSSLPNYGPVNWSRMTTFPVTATFNYSATAIISADGKTIAVSDGTLRMYRSDDNGVTWTQRGSSITDPANGTRQNNQGFSNTISISSNGLTVLIAGNPMYSGGVSAQFLSYDWDGTNWNSSLVREFSWGVTISNAISADASTCIVSISNNSYNNGTIYRYSRVGLGSWTLVNSMSLSYWFYTVSISNNAKYLSLTRPQYNVSDFGDAEVYAWNGTTYDPIINNRNIKNRTLGNPSEFNASLTSSGSRFVVGGVGKVDVYDLNGTPNYIKIYNDPAFRIIATSSDSTGAITYTSSNTNVANITDTNLITIGNVGSSTINANISATTNYTSSTTSALLTVNQATPSLSNFTVAAKNYGDSSFSLTAPTSNSSGAFTYTSSNTSVATISGSTVTVVNAGSTTITATQASTSNYTSGTITATFIVNQIAPSISNFSVPTKNFGNASFSLTAPTSNSGGAFTYTSSNTAVATISGSTVTIVGGGTSTITATQSSTTNYTSGSITATFTVNPIAPTISNFSVPTKKFGDLSFSLTAPTTNSAGSFSYISSDTSVATISGSTATLTGPGTTTITATQAATANYTSGTITATFTITPNQGMALSGDGLVFALGKPNFNSQAGKVDIYSWNGTTWVQKGSTLNGSSGDSFGYSISLSNAGNIIVIGAYSGQSTRGYAKVYEFVSNDWQLKGSQINGDNTNDEFTRSISLSLDGTTFAGGSPASNYVKIFSWDGSAWTQKGSTLTGEASSRYSESIQLSSDGSLIAIGAPNFTTNTGYTKVFEFVSSSWTQKGSTLNGSATNEYFGYSVSLAGTDLVVGAYGGSTNTGYLKYYKWINSSWQQKGGTVTGSGTGNNFGYSVAVSSNNKIVTGAYGLSSNTGQVKAYNYNPFPSNPTNGQVFYNVDDNNLYIYDESGWVYNNFTSDGSIVNTSTSILNGAVTVGSTLNVSGNTTLTGNVGIGQAPSATYKVDVLGSVRSSLFTTTSDYRIKEDISDISEDVDELKPIKYKNKLNNKLEYGFIAHEVQDVFPDMVYGNKDGEEYQSINYTELIPILVHEIQQLKEEIRNLKRQ